MLVINTAFTSCPLRKTHEKRVNNAHLCSAFMGTYCFARKGLVGHTDFDRGNRNRRKLAEFSHGYRPIGEVTDSSSLHARTSLEHIPSFIYNVRNHCGVSLCTMFAVSRKNVSDALIPTSANIVSYWSVFLKQC